MAKWDIGIHLSAQYDILLHPSQIVLHIVSTVLITLAFPTLAGGTWMENRILPCCLFSFVSFNRFFYPGCSAG